MLPEDVNTVIVGAGPSGLLNAIGLLTKNPDKKILILEKREEYSRNHVVRFDYRNIEKYIKTIGGQEHSELVNLAKRLKKNPAIRINELEDILKGLAKKLGAEIEYVKIDGVPAQIDDVPKQIYDKYPNVELVIGADGTHSKVSETAFGKDNQIKHSFDYVMQIRFEVEGSNVQAIDLPSWPAYLQAYGVAGEEVMGKTKDGKTPITMQIMVSKEDFDILTPHATSKTPIRPFNDKETKLDVIPDQILRKIKGYMGLRLAHYTQNNTGEKIDMSDVRISVNEAPATRAKSVVQHVKHNDRKICVMLTGDAALGLSYFKGMDACFENTSKALVALNSSSKEERDSRLKSYSEWFDSDFAPRKIQEVAQYSTYGARLPVAIFSFLNKVFGTNFAMDTAQAERFADLYHGNQRELATGATGDILSNPYPHRKNYWMPVLNATPLPISERLAEINKHFSKFFKAYKSIDYFTKDLLQPFTAIKNIIYGTVKIAFALPVLIIVSIVNVFTNRTWGDAFNQIKRNFFASLSRIVDGFFQIIQGGILAVTSPLLPIKIGVNSILTLSKDTPKIETNPGMKRLIESTEQPGLSNDKMNALCIDMHRKFEKGLNKKQKTEIEPEVERQAFKKCKLGDQQSYDDYFSLFAKKKNVALATPVVEEPTANTKQGMPL